MKMSILYLLLLIMLVLATSGCTVEWQHRPNATNQTHPTIIAAPTSSVREPSIVYVEIKGSAFNPTELKIANGTTVQWKNQDSAQHAIKVGNSSSPPLNKREMWNYTFNGKGTFEYNCTIHPWMQHGGIIVE